MRPRWLVLAIVLALLVGVTFSSWAAPKVVGSGGVGGTCATGNSLGKFSSAFTLGCSGVTDDGTNVTLTGRGLRFSTDSSADIGGSHTTLRPANVWVGTLVDSPKFTTTGTGSNSGVTLGSNERVGMANDYIAFNGSNQHFDFATSNDGATSGGTSFGRFTPSITPPSGTGSFAALHLNPTINGTSSGTAYVLGVASKTNTFTGGSVKLASFGTTSTDLFTGYTALVDVDTTGLTRSTLYGTVTRCANTGSPATCAAAPAGSVVIAAAATAVVVNTTAITANSQVFAMIDRSLGALLSVTCDTTSDLTTGSPAITARSAGTSFTIAVPVAPAANPMCLSYFIIN